MINLAIDYLARLRGAKLDVDLAGVGWIGHIPITAEIVRRWENAGLIEDYGVGTKTLTAKGERIAQGERVAA